MTHLRRLLLLTALLLVPLPLSALSDGPVEDLNRRELTKLRKEPEQYARLRREAREFAALPEARQSQLIKIDHDIHEQRPALQARLMDALKRYADWLDSLPEEDRKKIKEATDREDRLNLIRQARGKEWLRTLPRTQRHEIEKLQGKARAERIAKIKQEERQREREWQVTVRHWNEVVKGNKTMPTRPSEFPDRYGMPSFVNEYLKPMLSAEEWERLQKAEGQWPLYPCTLVDLADKYPLALPGPRGPTHPNQLPERVRELLAKKAALAPKGALKRAEGKWPEYAIAVMQHITNKHSNEKLPHELWPRRYQDLSATMQSFVTHKLRPVLDAPDREQLDRAVNWPNYPLTIKELAARYYLTVPWQSLPGSREEWDSYRYHHLQPVRQVSERPGQ